MRLRRWGPGPEEWAPEENPWAPAGFRGLGLDATFSRGGPDVGAEPDPWELPSPPVEPPSRGEDWDSDGGAHVRGLHCCSEEHQRARVRFTLLNAVAECHCNFRL